MTHRLPLLHRGVSFGFSGKGTSGETLTLHYVNQLEAVHLGDLLRLWVRPGVKAIPSGGFSRVVGGAPDRA